MSFFAQEDRFVKAKDDGITRRYYMPKSELSSRGAPKIIDDWNINSSENLGRPMPELLNNPWNSLSMICAHRDPPVPNTYNPNLNTVRPSSNTGAKWQVNTSPRFRYPTQEPKEVFVPAPPPSRTPSSFNKRLMSLSDSSPKGLMRLDFLRSTSPGASTISEERSRTSPTQGLGQGLGPGLSFAPNASVDATSSVIGGFGGFDGLDGCSMFSNESVEPSAIVGKNFHGNVRFAVPRRKKVQPSPPVSQPRCSKNDAREALRHLRVVLGRDRDPPGRREGEIQQTVVALASGGVPEVHPQAQAPVETPACGDNECGAEESGGPESGSGPPAASQIVPSPVVETAETRKAKREEARRQHHCAARIQALQRGKSARRATLTRFQQREQEMERSCHQPAAHFAATKVQSLIRGKSGRRLSKQRRQERAREKEGKDLDGFESIFPSPPVHCVAQEAALVPLLEEASVHVAETV